MNESDLPKISKAVSSRLGAEIVFVSFEKVGSGYHAEGYKLTSADGQHYFIKRVTTTTSGFEFPERKVFSLMVGHGMAKRANMSPRPVGLMLEIDGEIHLVPEMSDDMIVYHVQEFESGGKSYAALLGEREGKPSPDARDEAEIENVTEYLSRLHAIRHPSSDQDELNRVYNDGLRAEIVHPEITLPLLHEFDDAHPLIPPEKQGEYVGLLIRLMHRFKNRANRLCALHGDFWGGNVFIREDASVWVIDYSRVPWGDPGIDVGKWMSYYLWCYYKTGNAYFKKLGDLFLDSYIRKTADEEIRESLCLGLMFSGVLYAMTEYAPEVPLERRAKLFEHISSVLRRGRFSWDIE